MVYASAQAPVQLGVVGQRVGLSRAPQKTGGVSLSSGLPDRHDHDEASGYIDSL